MTGALIKKKEHLSIFTIVALIFTILFSSTPLAGAAPVLSDLEGHWAQSAIQDMVKEGIIGGYPDGTFKPNNNISRAEFATLLVRAFNLEPGPGKIFGDTADHWARDAIGTANYHGLVSGYSDSIFGPDDPVTREQMAVMIVKATKAEPTESGKAFTDSAQIAGWAEEAVAKATAAGIISGYPDGTFRPKANATRAEAAVILARSMKLIKEEAVVTVYDSPGIYGPESGTQTIAGDVTISADGVILQNIIIKGNLTISEEVGSGDVTLNNVTVEGTTVIRGGGKDSIHINGGQYNNIIIESTPDGNVRVVAINVEGLKVIISENAAREEVILEGTFDSVEIRADNVVLSTQGETIVDKITVHENIRGTILNIEENATVKELILDSVTEVNNAEGTVEKISGAKEPDSDIANPPQVTPAPVGGGGGGGDGGPSIVKVSAISVEPTTMTLTVGDTRKITATVEPSNATNKKVNWSSSDESVATVDENGNVRAVAPGTATITATSDADSTKKDSCVVTVVKPVVREDGDVTQDTGFTGGKSLEYDFVAEGKVLTIDAKNTKLPYYEEAGSTPPRGANWVGVAIPIPDGVNTEDVTATINDATCEDLFFAEGKYMEYIDVKDGDLSAGTATYTWVIKWGSGYADETITINLTNVAGLDGPLPEAEVSFTFNDLDDVTAGTVDFSITAKVTDNDAIAEDTPLRYKAEVTKDGSALAGQVIKYPEAGDSLEDPSTWHSFTTDENGIAYFGPSGGFTLTQLPALLSAEGVTTPFQADFAAGSYSVTVYLLDISEGEEELGSGTKEFTVAAPQPEVTFTFTGLDDVTAGTVGFTVNTKVTDNDAIAEDTPLRYKAVVTKDGSALADQVIKYGEGFALTFTTNDEGTAYFGPFDGFTLADLPALLSEEGRTTPFQADFAAGNYSVTVSLVDISGEEEVVLGSGDKTFIVEAPEAEVTFTFEGLDDVTEGTVDFEITAKVTDNDAIAEDTPLRYKAVVTKDGSALADQVIKYPEAGDSREDPSTWHSFTTDENGIAYFGPSGGFTLTQLPALLSAEGVTTPFQADFAAGSYSVTVYLLDISEGEEELGSGTKEFTVGYAATLSVEEPNLEIDGTVGWTRFAGNIDVAESVEAGEISAYYIFEITEDNLETGTVPQYWDYQGSKWKNFADEGEGKYRFGDAGGFDLADVDDITTEFQVKIAGESITGKAYLVDAATGDIISNVVEETIEADPIEDVEGTNVQMMQVPVINEEDTVEEEEKQSEEIESKTEAVQEELAENEDGPVIDGEDENEEINEEEVTDETTDVTEVENDKGEQVETEDVENADDIQVTEGDVTEEEAARTYKVLCKWIKLPIKGVEHLCKTNEKSLLRSWPKSALQLKTFKRS